jgi:hypothetical protein
MTATAVTPRSIRFIRAFFPGVGASAGNKIARYQYRSRLRCFDDGRMTMRFLSLPPSGMLFGLSRRQANKSETDSAESGADDYVSRIEQHGSNRFNIVV